MAPALGSLRLFTPAQFNGLPGMPFPGGDNYFPSKDEAADYLESYALKFHLPIRPDTKIERLERDGESYRLGSTAQSFKARNIIVATGAYQSPYIPTFAAQLDPAICQLHSYRLSQPGPGSGRTGAGGRRGQLWRRDWAGAS